MTADDPLPGWRPGPTGILVTRPEPGLTATSARIRALGLIPVPAPLLRIVQLAANLPPAGSIGAVVVTSANALPALPAALRPTRLLAVGDATAAEARAAGFAQVASAGRDAVALAELADSCLPRGTAILLASGEGQGEPLAADLRLRGFLVHHCEVYAARPVDALPEAAVAALDSGRIAAALFFSAETARVFTTLPPAASDPAMLSDIDALAISPTAAGVLALLPWKRIRVASHPNQDELLALLS